MLTVLAATPETVMPARSDAPIGAPCWVDLSSSDPAASKAFYGSLFGWSARESGEEFGHYATFELDGVPVAGCMASQDPGMPDAWVVYLATDAIDAVAASAEAHGGQVLMAPMPVGPLGSMAILLDACGAAVGAWQPGEHRGIGVLAEPGAPSWFELHTRGYVASLAFYRSVFGWDLHTMSDAPEFRYTTLGEGETALAGLMDDTGHTPEGTPPHWAFYVQVADADDAVARVGELGGTVEMGPADTPYGRLVGITDPTGARLMLQQP